LTFDRLRLRMRAKQHDVLDRGPGQAPSAAD